MREWSEAERRAGNRIAFVPTMGFLHRGASVFGARRQDTRRPSRRVDIRQSDTVRPGEDSRGYPRDFERDCELLKPKVSTRCFHPSVEEMYPQGGQTLVEVEKLSLPLCGASRPGHFRGVATVVTKLFNIVLPHLAVFGEKDYQQLQVIRRLVRDLRLGVEIIGHPIVREADGLAMSSRNAYLSETERAAAVCLSRALCKAERLFRRGETFGARRWFAMVWPSSKKSRSPMSSM